MKCFDLIILGPLPNANNIKDGMIQRVADIDKNIFNGKKRLYIKFSIKKNIYNNHLPQKIDENLYVVNISILNITIIKKLFSHAKYIYIHSLHNVILSLPWILFTTAKIYYDVHGIVVEESLYNKKYITYIIASICEKMFFSFKKNFNIVYVTNTMKEYIRKKYRFAAKDFIIPIYPQNLKNINNEKDQIERIKLEYNIDNNDTVFIYSGNTQKWQNIELMLQYIKILSSNANYKFFILTADYNKMIEFIRKKKIKNVIVKSVSPIELSTYYEISHYGFLLRDHHPLNHVACPTKAIEYLAFGIIPIVLEENIGDFKQLGYEYLSINNINNEIKLRPRKSSKNMEISKYLYEFSNNEKKLLKNEIKA